MPEVTNIDTKYDVLVAGGGNAAMCAAIEAARAGGRVLVLEVAPKDYRGGNTRHTRNMRIAHHAATETLTGPYPVDEFLDDLLAVTKGATDEPLARLLLEESLDMWDWMRAQGVAFAPSLEGSLSLGRTNAFFLGGGRAMLNALYRTADRVGVEVVYDTEVVDVELDADTGRFTAVKVERQGERQRVEADVFVAASGGYQADLDWMERSWGPEARNFIIRGTPYNRGVVLRLLQDSGAAVIGDPTQCHAVAVDGRAPTFDGGIVTRLDCVPFGIVVNQNGVRFHDEGEEFWPKRYAIWGRLVALQPDQIGYVIIDSKSIDLFMPSVFPPVVASSVEGLAEQMGLDPSQVTSTVDEFNAACVPGEFDHTVHDDCHTDGLAPPKSHWARPINEPPFYGYTLKCGVTFTYLGVKVDDTAAIQMASGASSPNMFAAGEIMAGNILGQGYLAGLGMTIGSVFGRLAGRSAGRTLQRGTGAGAGANAGPEAGATR